MYSPPLAPRSLVSSSVAAAAVFFVLVERLELDFFLCGKTGKLPQGPLSLRVVCWRGHSFREFRRGACLYFDRPPPRARARRPPLLVLCLAINCAPQACKEAMKSDRLAKILEKVLDIGNLLNEGGFRVGGRKGWVGGWYADGAWPGIEYSFCCCKRCCYLRSRRRNHSANVSSFTSAS